MDTGSLIVIEGADGAGKATQTKLLVERLRAEGKRVETLDFPRYVDNHFGRLIREVLDEHDTLFVDLPPKVASVLTAADRFESKAQLTAWLSEGAVVILDRYASSNMLHQGAKVIDPTARQSFLDWLNHMEHEIFGIPKPDLVIYLNVPTTERQRLLFADLSRQTVDAAERSHDHQFAADACATELIERFQWYEIICVAGGALRPIESIHEDVYREVRAIL